MARIPKLDAAGKFLAADVNAQIDARAKAAMAPLLAGKRGVEATELGTEHLDTVTTPGVYSQSSNLEATLAAGYPQTRAGTLQVERSSDKKMVWQTYTTYAPTVTEPANTYVRAAYNGAWTAWSKAGGSGMPEGGKPGQVLTTGADGKATWGAVSQTLAWSKDAQAKAQGYWIEVSPTAPAKGTYTTADGTVVPVIWQKPIEVMVPVIPEAPYFDKYALSIQVASLVGVDYYLTGFTKDGATVDVPDVKIPDGGILKLSDVPGKPALPYTVNVEARAEPGYKLPSPISWTYSVVDPKQVKLFTSDTFTGRATDPTPLYNTTTDAALGGSAKLWDATWEASTGNRDRLFTVSGGALKVDLTVGRAAVGVKGIGFNQKAEFDLAFSSDAWWGASTGEGVFFHLAGDTALGGSGRLYLAGPFEGAFSVRVGTHGAYQEIAKKRIGELSGHYSLEVFENSMIVSIPGTAPVTVPLTRTYNPLATWFSVEANRGTPGKGSFAIDNLKLSTIGF